MENKSHIKKLIRLATNPWVTVVACTVILYITIFEASPSGLFLILVIIAVNLWLYLSVKAALERGELPFVKDDITSRGEIFRFSRLTFMLMLAGLLLLFVLALLIRIIVRSLLS